MEAVCYGCLGSVFQSINNMVEAKEYHEKALEITIEIGDREGQGICYKQLRKVFQSLWRM